MTHQHKYDKNGKQLCCTQQEKIYANAGAKHLLHESHTDDDGRNHDHENNNQTTLQMFTPPIISLALLLVAIAFDYYVQPEWFSGWVCIVWYAVAYIPVGFPVMKEAFESIRKGQIFSEFLLMCIATIGAFSIGEYPEGVAVMLFYAVGEVFQTLAVKRAKANIKTLLDQRPDEVTILENNQPKIVKTENVNIGDIIQLKSGEKLGLDGELISETASFNTAALTGESKPDTKAKGDHHVFEFWHNDIFVTKTKTSHNSQDINGYLIKAMSNQCRDDKDFFIEFAKCTKSKEDYIDKLVKNGTIK